ncbi:unnamed protein product [Phytomonas sp. Hart1]|nr:unnamed protein product [Phytomonas sp. Hart1]|eukprot:CCW69653.1 unnamed protein product [Phytomonas sp. isolate Hart1]
MAHLDGVDYRTAPLFFDLPTHTPGRRTGAASGDFATRELNKNRHFDPSAGDFTPGGAVGKSAGPSEPTSPPLSSRKARFRSFVENKSFLLRCEAMQRREEARMAALQHQDESPEDDPPPVVFDANPQTPQTTKAARLRAEWIARRFNSKETADVGVSKAKDREILHRPAAASENHPNASPPQAPAARLTRSARLFKEYTARRILEKESERARKAAESENAGDLSHSSIGSGPPLGVLDHRTPCLPHRRLAEGEISRPSDYGSPRRNRGDCSQNTPPAVPNSAPNAPDAASAGGGAPTLGFFDSPTTISEVLESPPGISGPAEPLLTVARRLFVRDPPALSDHSPERPPNSSRAASQGEAALQNSPKGVLSPGEAADLRDFDKSSSSSAEEWRRSLKLGPEDIFLELSGVPDFGRPPPFAPTPWSFSQRWFNSPPPSPSPMEALSS